jgi:hypothetical protein
LKPTAVFDSDGRLDSAATTLALLEEFPELSTSPVGLMISAVESTLGDVRPHLKKRPQYLWLFFLAGRLKRFFSTEDQADEKVALALSPFAWVFADLLRANALTSSKNRIDWDDDEAVEIEWLNAWANRKLPVGTSALQEAFEIALQNPLQLSGNRYFVTIVNMGYALQQANGDFPFILPVNRKVADLVGTTVTTISASISKAIRDGLFIVNDSKFSPSAGKARTFRFNYEHPLIAKPSILPERTLTSDESP